MQNMARLEQDYLKSTNKTQPGPYCRLETKLSVRTRGVDHLLRHALYLPTHQPGYLVSPRRDPLICFKLTTCFDYIKYCFYFAQYKI